MGKGCCQTSSDSAAKGLMEQDENNKQLCSKLNGKPLEDFE